MIHLAVAVVYDRKAHHDVAVQVGAVHAPALQQGERLVVGMPVAVARADGNHRDGRVHATEERAVSAVLCAVVGDFQHIDAEVGARRIESRASLALQVACEQHAASGASRRITILLLFGAERVPVSSGGSLGASTLRRTSSRSAARLADAVCPPARSPRWSLRRR